MKIAIALSVLLSFFSLDVFSREKETTYFNYCIARNIDDAEKMMSAGKEELAIRVVVEKDLGLMGSDDFLEFFEEDGYLYLVGKVVDEQNGERVTRKQEWTHEKLRVILSERRVLRLREDCRKLPDDK